MSRRRNRRPGRGSAKPAAGFTDRSGKVHARPAAKGGEGRPPRPERIRDRDREQVRHREDRHRADRRPARGSGPAGASAKATVDKNRKGFGFLIFEDRRREDVFLPPRQAERLFHGDRVEVSLGSRGEVRDLRVLQHRFRELVGRFTPQGNGGWVVYEQKRAREEVFVPQLPPGGVPATSWVRAKLHFHESGPYGVTAEVLEVYGKELPPSADVGMIAAEFSLVEAHTEASEREARAFELDLDLAGGHRRDLRNVPFITIDGETARDFDDAVYVERGGREAGSAGGSAPKGFVLWVAIADVSHYVADGTALDRDARSRGTSVYFPERAFHMLPRALSENLCSLRPGEPRLALTARMELSPEGKLLKTEVIESLIQSRRRATYNEIQREWEQEGRDPKWEYAPHFQLYRLLRKRRSERGSIDFDLPEAEMVVKPTGEVVSIRERPRLDAHRLIEEFMIAANEAVTDWMMRRHWPFVYRVHEEPSAESLDKFQQLAAHLGVRVALRAKKGGDQGPFGAADPRLMAEVVRRLEGHPAQVLLNMALLRSMKQAVYSSTHGIHYGLASTGYTHFTSPIRRYPDLVVHRLLRRALRADRAGQRKIEGGARDKLERELADICEHCSYRERLAAEAERESIKLKQARALAERLGDEFTGTINGMLEGGMFVRLADPYCEGLVSRESMVDDLYEFIEERMAFVGRRKKRTFKVGEQVEVRVLRASIETRQIDFGLVDGGPTLEQAQAGVGRRGDAGPRARSAWKESRPKGKRREDDRARGGKGRGRRGRRR